MGAYFARSSYLVFCATPTLRGHACWGVPPLEEIQEMIALFAIARQPEHAPHRWLVDLRFLHHIEAAAFGICVEFVQQARRDLSGTILRQAQLRPPGMLGAIIAGFSAIARLPYDERVFDEPDAALSWLGVDLEEGRAALRKVQEVREAALAGVQHILRLRHLLAEDPRLTLGVVAKRMSLSPRQLQRELSRSGTTFREEVRRCQLERADRLLAQTDLSITQVALEAGFASPQHFAVSFRESRGTTPTDWRRSRRSLESRH